ncbi:MULTISPECIES: hypothetical protein [Pseudoalteromonas]|uniref:hypothetical protein n=1 Tax=Pseudoalteromonas TaxID=53246 RepID=UPI00158238CE|nr:MULTISPECIES: hypothetical protein [Pseudoalteromonas]MDI4653603.1 hypothetical protein [Pseudoalteromonas shioyasakiensis]NUJ39363.1 hypothetical protein [Pseudoalteromonas sp. 0303]
MAIYIKTEGSEQVILDPKGDDELIIERFSSFPHILEIRKATDDEIKRLYEPEMSAGRLLKTCLKISGSK